MDPQALQAAQDALDQQAMAQAAQDALNSTDTSWQQAGEDALGGGTSGGWQDAGSAAAAGAPPGMSYGWGGAGREGVSGSFGIGAGNGAAGGSSQAGSGSAIPSPSPITGGSGGSGGGGGGSGGGSAAGTGQQNPQNPAQGGSSGAIGTSGNSSSALSGLLGVALQSILGKGTSSVGAPDLGLNIPGISTNSNVYSGSQDAGSSFGGLLSSPAATTDNSQPQTMTQAAQDSLQSFTGAGKGESGSPFQGGLGSAGASAGSGSGFSGSPPTPFQAMASGQMTQPGTMPSSDGGTQAPSADLNSIHPDIAGMYAGGSLGAPQGANPVPGAAPLAQAGSSPGGATNGSEGASGNAPGQTGSAGPKGASGTAAGMPAAMSMKTIVDPLNPKMTYQVSTGDNQPAKVVTDPNNPDMKYTIGGAADAGRAAMEPPDTKGGLNPTGAPTGTALSRLDPQAQAMFKGGAQGLKNTAMNAMNTAAYPFRDDAGRKAADQAYAADNAKADAENSKNPFVYSASKTAGEIAPWAAAQLAFPEVSAAKIIGNLAAKISSGAITNGLYGLTQPGTGTERLENAAVGAAVGTAANLLGPLFKGLNAISSYALPAVGAIGGAGYGVYSGHGGMDTALKAAGYAATGAAAGKSIQSGGAMNWLKGVLFNKGAPAAEVTSQVAAKVEPTVAKAAVGDAAANAYAPKMQAIQGELSSINLANLPKTEADKIANLRAIAASAPPEVTPNVAKQLRAGAPGSLFDESARYSAQKAAQNPQVPPNAIGDLNAPPVTNMAGPTPGTLPGTPSVPEQGLLSKIAPTATHVATLATTKGITGITSGQSEAPKEAQPIKSFVMPPAPTPEAVQAHASTPMQAQLPDPMVKSLSSVQTYKDKQAALVATKIMASSPDQFAAKIATADGRNELLDLAYKYEGAQGVKDLQVKFNQLDGVKVNATKGVNDSVAQQMQLAGAGKSPSYVPGVGLVPPGGPQGAATGQPAAGVPGGAIAPPRAGMVAPGPGQAFAANPANVPGQGPNGIARRAGYLAPGKAMAMKSGANAQIMSLVMSYLMKGGQYQAMMKAGGLQGQMAGLLPGLIQSRSGQ